MCGYVTFWCMIFNRDTLVFCTIRSVSHPLHYNITAVSDSLLHEFYNITAVSVSLLHEFHCVRLYPCVNVLKTDSESKRMLTCEMWMHIINGSSWVHNLLRLALCKWQFVGRFKWPWHWSHWHIQIISHDSFTLTVLDEISWDNWQCVYLPSGS